MKDSDIKIPIVSIIMATYNRAHLIGESLSHIQQQSLKDFECLIIDDGSTDNTSEIVSAYIKGDPRFRYLKRKEKYKKGLPGCRNYGLDMAKGDFIVFFDDDDIVHPDLLKTCLNVLEKNPSDFCRFEKKPFIGTWKPKIINKDSNFRITRFYSDEIDKMITGEIAFASCCVLWNKKCFENIRFNEELQYAEEWECYSRILMNGREGISIDKILYFNRKHPNSNTGEFWNNDPVRMASKVKAIKLVINNLKQNHFLTEKLFKYFIRWGFQFKNPEIINYTLKHFNSGVLKTFKYKIGYTFYPLLKPLLELKGKLIKN